MNRIEEFYTVALGLLSDEGETEIFALLRNIRDKTQRDVTLSEFYFHMERLQNAGCVTLRSLSDPRPGRPGFTKDTYQITDIGGKERVALTNGALKPA